MFKDKDRLRMRGLSCFYDARGPCIADLNGERYGVFQDEATPERPNLFAGRFAHRLCEAAASQVNGAMKALHDGIKECFLIF